MLQEEQTQPGWLIQFSLPLPCAKQCQQNLGLEIKCLSPGDAIMASLFARIGEAPPCAAVTELPLGHMWVEKAHDVMGMTH